MFFWPWWCPASESALCQRQLGYTSCNKRGVFDRNEPILKASTKKQIETWQRVRSGATYTLEELVWFVQCVRFAVCVCVWVCCRRNREEGKEPKRRIKTVGILVWANKEKTRREKGQSIHKESFKADAHQEPAEWSAGGDVAVFRIQHDGRGKSGGAQLRWHSPRNVQGHAEEDSGHEALSAHGSPRQLRPHSQRVFLRQTSRRLCPSSQLLQVSLFAWSFIIVTPLIRLEIAMPC